MQTIPANQLLAGLTLAEPVAIRAVVTVFILYMSEHDNVFIRCFVEQESRLCHQGVEPATCLVNSL